MLTSLTLTTSLGPSRSTSCGPPGSGPPCRAKGWNHGHTLCHTNSELYPYSQSSYMSVRLDVAAWHGWGVTLDLGYSLDGASELFDVLTGRGKLRIRELADLACP